MFEGVFLKKISGIHGPYIYVIIALKHKNNTWDPSKLQYLLPIMNIFPEELICAETLESLNFEDFHTG